MGQPVLLQNRFTRMVQDQPRYALPRDAVWNMVDFLPDLLDGNLGKRGGWSYGSPALAGVASGAVFCFASIYATFSGGAQRLAITDNAKLVKITSDTAATLVTTGVNKPSQTPVMHADKLVIPQAGGVPIQLFDGTTLTTTAGPGIHYVAVYKDRTVGANGDGTNSRNVYFSNAGDPSTWDLTNAVLTVSQPVTGLAALPNALLVFMGDRTARIRGSIPPPGSDMVLDDPIFNVGCADAQSIAVNGPYVIFANPTGVYVSNGTNVPEDLTQAAGLKRYWITQCTGFDFSAGWHIAGGMLRNRYFVSIMNGTGFIDGFLFDPAARSGIRISNLTAWSFAPAVGVTEELYAASRTTDRVLRLSTVFNPTASVKNDADTTILKPVVETPFYYDPRSFRKRFRRMFLTYDMRDAASDAPAFAISYLKTPEAAYVNTGALFKASSAMTEARLAINVRSPGIAFKFAQNQASSLTRIAACAAEVSSLEASRLT